MKSLVLACALLVLATWSHAGQNPMARIYLDVDPPNKVHEVQPQASETFDVYICFDTLGGGIRATGFLLTRTFGGFKLAQDNLLGGLDFGDVEVDGWTIAAGEECVEPEGCIFHPVVVAARITYLYIGTPGTLTLHPHPGTGRHTVDCLFNEDDFYCIAGNLGVWAEPEPGEIDCYGVPWSPPHARCEPQQPGDTHPPHYWYRSDAGVWTNDIHGFHVQVFDPDYASYTEWAVPEGWVHSDAVVEVGGDYWVSWCDPEGDDPLWGHGPFVFRFDNPNPAVWGHWTLTGSTSPCDPLADVVISSHAFEECEDGLGFRVHVPCQGTPVLPMTWGAVKALYR